MNENSHPAVIDYLYSSEPDEILKDYLSIERLTEPYEPIKMKLEKLKGLFEAIKTELEQINLESQVKEEPIPLKNDAKIGFVLQMCYKSIKQKTYISVSL